MFIFLFVIILLVLGGCWFNNIYGFRGFMTKQIDKLRSITSNSSSSGGGGDGNDDDDDEEDEEGIEDGIEDGIEEGYDDVYSDDDDDDDDGDDDGDEAKLNEKNEKITGRKVANSSNGNSNGNSNQSSESKFSGLSGGGVNLPENLANSSFFGQSILNYNPKQRLIRGLNELTNEYIYHNPNRYLHTKQDYVNALKTVKEIKKPSMDALSDISICLEHLKDDITLKSRIENETFFYYTAIATIIDGFNAKTAPDFPVANHLLFVVFPNFFIHFILRMEHLKVYAGDRFYSNGWDYNKFTQFAKDLCVLILRLNKLLREKLKPLPPTVPPNNNESPVDSLKMAYALLFASFYLQTPVEDDDATWIMATVSLVYLQRKDMKKIGRARAISRNWGFYTDGSYISANNTRNFNDIIDIAGMDSFFMWLFAFDLGRINSVFTLSQVCHPTLRFTASSAVLPQPIDRLPSRYKIKTVQLPFKRHSKISDVIVYATQRFSFTAALVHPALPLETNTKSRLLANLFGRRLMTMECAQSSVHPYLEPGVILCGVTLQLNDNLSGHIFPTPDSWSIVLNRNTGDQEQLTSEQVAPSEQVATSEKIAPSEQVATSEKIEMKTQAELEVTVKRNIVANHIMIALSFICVETIRIFDYLIVLPEGLVRVYYWEKSGGLCENIELIINSGYEMTTTTTSTSNAMGNAAATATAANSNPIINPIINESNASSVMMNNYLPPLNGVQADTIQPNVKVIKKKDGALSFHSISIPNDELKRQHVITGYMNWLPTERRPNVEIEFNEVPTKITKRAAAASAAVMAIGPAATAAKAKTANIFNSSMSSSLSSSSAPPPENKLGNGTGTKERGAPPPMDNVLCIKLPMYQVKIIDRITRANAHLKRGHQITIENL